MESSDHEQPHADALVMFGLTGDLGRKKLFPAIYELAAAGSLGIPVVGVGRSEHSDDDVRAMFRDAMDDHELPDGAPIDASVIEAVELSYLPGDSTDSATFDALVEHLDDVEAPLVYAALPPDLFGAVARGMAESDFPDAARLMVEKPFGSDVASAQELWDEMTGHISGESLFIVDHFLAKSAVENIAVVRHANALIANSLDAEHVTKIEIEMSEAGGVDGRGSFYEGVGAINDVVQSHLMQTFALLTMEAPDGHDEDDYRQQRVALLADVAPVDLEHVTLGQYDGYRDHDDVAADSIVETFVSMQLAIDNDRWRGVPITLRTGKRLVADSTVATFHLASTASSPMEVSNRIRFEIKPSPSVSFDIAILDPERHEPAESTVFACGPDDHPELGDYATMFDDARRGDHRHFAQIDGIIEAWRILAPLADAGLEIHTYEPGSKGPTA